MLTRMRHMTRKQARRPHGELEAVQLLVTHAGHGNGAQAWLQVCCSRSAIGFFTMSAALRS